MVGSTGAAALGWPTPHRTHHVKTDPPKFHSIFKSKDLRRVPVVSSRASFAPEVPAALLVLGRVTSLLLLPFRNTTHLCILTGRQNRA